MCRYDTNCSITLAIKIEVMSYELNHFKSCCSFCPSWVISQEISATKDCLSLTKSTFDGGKTSGEMIRDAKSMSMPCIISTTFHMRELYVR